MFADATYVKGRVGGRVVSRAVVVATGVTATGDREVLGVDVGDSEDGAFWTAFLQGPAGPRARRRAAGDLRPPPRPQAGHRARCSSAPPGSAAGCTSCATSWPGSPRPRPRWSPPPSARSSPSPTPPTSAPSSTRSPACSTASSPTSPPCSRDAAEDLLAFTGVPAGPLAQDLVHQPARADQRRDQAPHQRRRASSPTTPPSLRLVTAVLVETHDEWAVAERRYLSEESMAKIGRTRRPPTEETPLAITA